jgi:hypothetical protein
MLKLRNEHRARSKLDTIVGAWPGRRGHNQGGPSRTGSPGWQHAKAVWEGERAKVGRTRVAGREDSALPLVFVEAIARHAQSCRRCANPSAIDPVPAGEWLLWALAKVPSTRGVVRPVLRELGGRFVPSTGLPRPGQGTAHRRT